MVIIIIIIPGLRKRREKRKRTVTIRLGGIVTAALQFWLYNFSCASVFKNVLDNLFTGWNHKLKIEWPEWKVNLFLYTKDPLNYLILYTPFGEDYFCVEPVSNVTDAFNMMERNISGHGTKILKPGEILEGKVCFIPELY